MSTEDTPDIFAPIMELHTLYLGTAATHVKAAIRLGQALLALPGRAVTFGIPRPEGGWQQYMESEYGIGRRTWFRVCKLANQFGDKLELFNENPNIGITVLYELAREEYDEIREEIEARIGNGEAITVPEIKRAAVLSRLARSAPDVAQKLVKGEYTAQQAEQVADHLESSGAREAARRAVLQHNVSSPAVIEALAKYERECPGDFAEIAASGRVYTSLDEDGIPLAEASVTDVRLARREERVENFMEWLAGREDHLLDEARKRNADFVQSFSGRPRDLASQIAGLPELPHPQQYFIVTFQVGEE